MGNRKNRRLGGCQLYINQALNKRGNSNSPDAVNAKDWNFPQIDEGTPQCVFFGDCWTEDWQVLAYGNYRTTEIKKRLSYGQDDYHNARHAPGRFLRLRCGGVFLCVRAWTMPIFSTRD